MDEMTFEHALLERAASEVRYPETPRLRARVVDAIAADAPVRATAPARRAFAPMLGAAAAAVAGVAIAAAVAVPSSRGAIADFFGIEGSEIERLPTPAPGATPTPFPTPAGIASFATPASLASAAATAGYALAVPPGEGAPQGVYLLDYGEPVVVLEYAGFDLWQARLAEGAFFGKGAPGGVTIRDLTVNGEPARWISGGSHIIRFVDRFGREVTASQRTVDRNTLVWRTDYAFYRIETALPLEEALRIAESLP